MRRALLAVMSLLFAASLRAESAPVLDQLKQTAELPMTNPGASFEGSVLHSGAVPSFAASYMPDESSVYGSVPSGRTMQANLVFSKIHCEGTGSCLAGTGLMPFLLPVIEMSDGVSWGFKKARHAAYEDDAAGVLGGIGGGLLGFILGVAMIPIAMGFMISGAIDNLVH